ncbi:hypothetical protein QOZ80_5BG0451940 [Eleusine coracana subsp. coracana]|nr:hypothetical protein QOZ80_5BG0451940 [Eleusine coracana subsp. coracana]
MATNYIDQRKVKEKKEKVHNLRFDLLGLRIIPNAKIASCKLRIPSEVPPPGFNHENDPAAVLKLIPNNEEWSYCLKLMREISHPNILYARVVMSVDPKGSSKAAQALKRDSKKPSDLWALVEPYNGNLYDYLENILAMPCDVKSLADEVLLPAGRICTIIRQIIGGLEFLMLKGHYHGNFSLKSTYYHLEKDTGDICVKLSCFVKKGGKKTVCQKNDMVSLGNELGVLSSMINDVNKASDANDPHIDTSHIDDLAMKLKLVTEANMRQIYEVVKKHVMFWKTEDTKKFFVYRVAVAMTKSKFRQDVAECKDLLEDRQVWRKDDYDGFRMKMDTYRADNHMKAFDESCNCSFIEFIIGIYTHEHHLDNADHEADETVSKRHPNLRLKLRNLLRSDDVDWL